MVMEPLEVLGLLFSQWPMLVYPPFPLNGTSKNPESHGARNARSIAGAGPEPFPHLEHLNSDQLLQRRVEVSGEIEHLEQERQTIDADLQGIFSDSELRCGVRAPGVWILKQRSRTSWEYPSHARDAIKTLQHQAQKEGTAQRFTSTHLVLMHDSI